MAIKYLALCKYTIRIHMHTHSECVRERRNFIRHNRNAHCFCEFQKLRQNRFIFMFVRLQVGLWIQSIWSRWLFSEWSIRIWRNKNVYAVVRYAQWLPHVSWTLRFIEVVAVFCCCCCCCRLLMCKYSFFFCRSISLGTQRGQLTHLLNLNTIHTTATGIKVSNKNEHWKHLKDICWYCWDGAELYGRIFDPFETEMQLRHFEFLSLLLAAVVVVTAFCPLK